MRSHAERVADTGAVVPGSFSFKKYEDGRVYPGENRMEILFTPDDTEAYATAECTVTVTGIKYTITSVPYDIYINDKLPGTCLLYTSIFNLLVLVGSVKMADRVIREMMFGG